jgi:hypothetical protein
VEAQSKKRVTRQRWGENEEVKEEAEAESVVRAVQARAACIPTVKSAGGTGGGSLSKNVQGL